MGPLDIPVVTTLVLKAMSLMATSRGLHKELRREQEVAMNLWGSVLFEMRANAERIRFFLHRVDAGLGWYGTLSFDVVDSVLPELCRRVPQPITLDQMSLVLASMRRFDLFQRLAGQSMIDPDKGDPKHKVALGFARSFVHRGHMGRFNQIRDLADSVGQRAFKKDWSVLSQGILPPQLDLTIPPTEDFV